MLKSSVFIIEDDLTDVEQQATQYFEHIILLCLLL
jgi:hypothetical protein